jgi:hypothetical protein
MATSGELQKLDKNALEIAMEELQIFDNIHVNTSLRESEIHEIFPETHPQGLEPVTFEISGSNSHYYDLANTLLHLQIMITNADGTKLDDDGTKVFITPGQQILHSLISKFSILLNHKQVEDNVNYAYKAFVTNVLNHDEGAKTTHLRTVGWMHDGMTEEHTENMTGAQNAIMKARAAALAGSPVLDLIGRLNSPLFMQKKYMLPGISMRFELQFNTPQFVLQHVKGVTDPHSYKVVITKASMLMRRLEVHPSISISHIESLRKTQAKYVINGTDVKFFTISPGRQSENLTVLQNKPEPKLIILGLTKHTAKNGTYEHSPFKFESFNLSSINVMVNNNYALKKPLEMNFERNIYMRAYHNLQSVCGKTFTEQGNNITPEHFKSSLCLYAFDLTADWCHGEGTHLQRISDTKIELTFSQPLAETVNLMVYYEYDDVLNVDELRNPTLASVS